MLRESQNHLGWKKPSSPTINLTYQVPSLCPLVLQEARLKARQTPVESHHAPSYCPNSQTFIVNLTGVNSVSHKIIGQKHSDKQLQENNPTCKKTTPLVISSHVDLVLEARGW